MRTHASVRDLPPDARHVLDANAATNPFVSLPWLEAFETCLLRRAERPAYVVQYDGARATAVLPLVVTRHALLGPVRIRGMSNFYTGLFEAAGADATAEDRPRAVALAAEAAQHIAASWPRLALLEFAPVRDDHGYVATLVRALAGQGFRWRKFVAHANWHENVSGLDFERYLRRRPGRVRSTLTRKTKRLAQAHGLTIEIYDGEQSVARHFSEYERVYAASWKTPELSPEFIRTVMARLAGRGLVKLGVLSAGPSPAAAQLWVKIGASWGVFKLAYDPQFAEFSVGTILTARMIGNLLDDGATEELDFLSGDDAYKREWMSDRREHFGFEAISSRSAPGLALLLKRRLQGLALERDREQGRRGAIGARGRAHS